MRDYEYLSRFETPCAILTLRWGLSLLIGLFVLADAQGVEPSIRSGQPSVDNQGRSPSLVSASSSFVVRSYRGGPAAESMLAECRRLKREFDELWFPASETTPWSPRCEVVLHGARASYLAAVGRGGGMTRGSSLLEFQGARIVTRRIDLLIDDDHEATALRHELMHVVLAGHFKQSLPRWVDEGLATLADPAEKRRRHRDDLDYALQTETQMPLIRLLALEQVRSSEELAVFYGQSLSVVQFLVQRRGRDEFVRFVRAALDRGYDRALRETYEIDGIAHLQRLWHRHLPLDGDGSRLLTIDDSGSRR